MHVCVEMSPLSPTPTTIPTSTPDTDLFKELLIDLHKHGSYKREAL